MSTPPPPPQWVSSVVILGSLAGLLYNVLVIGPQGLPASYILGGLVAAYGGGTTWLQRKKDERNGDPP